MSSLGILPGSHLLKKDERQEGRERRKKAREEKLGSEEKGKRKEKAAKPVSQLSSCVDKCQMPLAFG